MQMASRGKRSRTRPPKKCSVDRLSPLPDDLLHRILSSLDFLDVVRTSVLSKRWRHVWASLPYLNFNRRWFEKHNYGKQIELFDPDDKFWDFIKWALLLRDGSQIIRISLSSVNIITEQLNRLILVAGRQKVQKLCLLDEDYMVPDEMEFPQVLCEALTVLTVHIPEITIRVSAVFSSLRSLYLNRVFISRDAAEKLLSSGCVKLENVHLEHCEFTDLEQINISACNLRNLTILNICTCSEFWAEGSFDCKLTICAPNLLSFCYIGPVLRGFALLNTVSLKHASVRFLLVPREYDGMYINHLPCPARFTGFNHAKALTLSSLVVKYFNELLWDTFILDNLNCLELELRYNVNYIKGLINLLKFSPNLEALVIRFKEGWSQKKTRKATEDRSSWKSRVEDIACLSYHVKIIQISFLDGSEIALELVKFLLLNGKVLEKMEIMHKNGERKQKSISKLLGRFKKASSEVVISFPKYAQRQIPWFDEGVDSDLEFDD